MSYTPIPFITDFILQSQAQLLQNFSISLRAFNENHVTFNAQDGGKHSALVLRSQVADVATAADEGALYVKSGTGAVPQIFWRPSSSQTPIQMTYQSVVNTGDIQHSFVAGPFIYYFGKISPASNGQVVALTPSSNTLITVLLQASSKDYIPTEGFATVAMPTAVAPTQFTINLLQVPTTPGVVTDVYYMALGVIV